MARNNKKTTPKPTDAELVILNVLWQSGPMTVRDVLLQLQQDRSPETGYTTVLKLMQIMTDKGLLERDSSQRPQVYRALITQEETQQNFISDLLDKAFGGSAKRLVMQVLANREASDNELSEIERLLDRLEKEN
ncbi:MAG TPA: BlaI/MecI/CopY family transcriptional regulator [Pyrinomonadaceae bacterium]|jgi:predicted transcriptional regulator